MSAHWLIKVVLLALVGNVCFAGAAYFAHARAADADEHAAGSSERTILRSFIDEYRQISGELEKHLIREDVAPPASAASGEAGGGAAGGGDVGEAANGGAGRNNAYGQDEQYGYDAPASVPSKKDVPSLPKPAGVGSGHDDDVVARQIREAAESETDPEIRRKLWEEYKDYKKEN